MDTGYRLMVLLATLYSQFLSLSLKSKNKRNRGITMATVKLKHNFD
jgi:hypothetical protein